MDSTDICELDALQFT